MSKQIVNQIGKKKLAQSVIGWEDAIQEAEEQLRRIKVQASAMRSAIRTFRHLSSVGEPFPAGRHTQNSHQN
jgi:hypothetical protein